MPERENKNSGFFVREHVGGNNVWHDQVSEWFCDDNLMTSVKLKGENVVRSVTCVSNAPSFTDNLQEWHKEPKPVNESEVAILM